MVSWVRSVRSAYRVRLRNARMLSSTVSVTSGMSILISASTLTGMSQQQSSASQAHNPAEVRTLVAEACLRTVVTDAGYSGEESKDVSVVTASLGSSAPNQTSGTSVLANSKRE